MVIRMKNVVIIGMADDRGKAPLEVENGEVWGCNRIILERDVDRVFWMDDNITKEAKERLTSSNTPLMSMANYPLDEITDKFGVDYFANSISYMIAYALHIEVEHIAMYGVAQGTTTELEKQKGSVEFWLGVALGMRVPFTINSRLSELLKVPSPPWTKGDHLLYSYGTPQRASRMARPLYKMKD